MMSKKLKDILNMEYYLKNECYCPGEIYSVDRFCYQIFKPTFEYEEIGKCEIEDNFLSRVPFIAVLSKSSSDILQILIIMYENNKILDIIRFDATENNIKLIKEVIKNNRTELKFDEYEDGKTAKELEKMFNIAGVVMID